MHGSIQRFLTHVFSIGQSELIVHSGRHSKYGSPWYSGWQVQIPFSQIAFAPQGDGLHASIGSSENQKHYSYNTDL